MHQEYKVGDIITLGNKKVKVVEFNIENKKSCEGCAFEDLNCTQFNSFIGNCLKEHRKDNKNIKFVEFIDNSEIKTYEDLLTHSVNISGYSFDSQGYFINNLISSSDDPVLAKTKKLARSIIASMKISQLIPYYGGEITDEEWKNSKIDKFCIDRYLSDIRLTVWRIYYSRLAFHTPEQRDEFLKYNEQLVKDYLMID